MRYHLINHKGVEYILDTRRHKLVCSCASGFGGRLVNALNTIGGPWWTWSKVGRENHGLSHCRTEASC